MVILRGGFFYGLMNDLVLRSIQRKQCFICLIGNTFGGRACPTSPIEYIVGHQAPIVTRYLRCVNDDPGFGSWQFPRLRRENDRIRKCRAYPNELLTRRARVWYCL